MNFEILVLLGITASFLIVFLYLSFMSFYNWCKSSLVEARVLGYKWSNPSVMKMMETPVTGFWPIITYNDGNKNITTPIKNIDLLFHEGKELKIRVANKQDVHVKMDFIFCLLLVWLGIFVYFIKSSMLVLYYAPFMTIIPIIIVFLYFRDHYKNFGTFHNSMKPIRPNKPINYEDMTEDDFKRIEKSDLVTYEEAMAHYYHRNKKSGKYLYPLIAIGVIAIVVYKVFG